MQEQANQNTNTFAGGNQVLLNLVRHPLLLIELAQLGQSSTARLLWANAAASAWMQLDTGQVLGEDIHTLSPFVTNPGLLTGLLECDKSLQHNPLVPVEVRPGERLWMRCRSIRVGRPERNLWAIYLEDHTGLESCRRQLAKAPYRDSLTGLKNRTSLLETLQNLPAAVHQCHLTLSLFQLEAIEALEMSLGVRGYEDLLLQVAQRFQRHAEGTHYYLGHGLFALLKKEPDLIQEAHSSHTGLIRSSLSEPYKSRHQQLRCGFRTGSAAYHREKTWSADMLPAMASEALRQSRPHHSDCLWESEEREYRHYSGVGLELVRLNRQIRFGNHYQCQIDLETGSLLGFEILGRYEMPKDNPGSRLSPERFFALARNLNLLATLDIQLLHRFLGEIGNLRADPLLGFSVNALPSSLEDAAYVQALIDTSVKLGCRRSLEVEITEHELAGDSQRLKNSMQRLREAGIGIALDDFGSGLSNLHYLVDMPLTRVKLDRSLIQRLEHSRATRKLVTACSQMCRSLGLDVVAEGIETQEQADAALHCGCGTGQGFLWGKPAALSELLGPGQPLAWLTKK